MENSRPVSTPIDASAKPAEEAVFLDDEQTTTFKSIVGALQWIAGGTRPDCLFAVNLLAQQHETIAFIECASDRVGFEHFDFEFPSQSSCVIHKGSPYADSVKLRIYK